MSGDSHRHVAVTAGTNIVLAGLNAATGVLLARLLGPTGRGELAAIQLWGFFLGVVAMLGIPDAVVYFVARDRRRAGGYLTGATLLNLLSSAAFIAVGYFIVPVVLGGQSAETKTYARLFLLIAVVYAVTGTPSQVLRGLAEFLRWNALRLLPAVLWLAVIGAAWATSSKTPGLLTVWFLLAMAASYVVVLAVALPRLTPPFRPEVSSWPQMLRFGLPTVLTSVPQTLNLRLDQMLMVAFVSSRELGLYVAAVAWSGVIGPLVTALGIVLFPRLASETDADVRVGVLFRGLRIALVLSCVMTAAALVVTPLAMRLLFGSAYSDATSVAVVLVIAGGLVPFNFVMQEGFRGLGKPSDVLWSELAALVATAAVLGCLLPLLGIMGAAIASVAGYGTTTVVLFLRLRRWTGPGVLARSRPHREDVRHMADGLRTLRPRARG